MARNKRNKTNNSDETILDHASTAPEAEEALVADGGYQMGIVETDEDEDSRDEERFKKAALELVATDDEDESMELVESLEIGEYKDEFLEDADWDPNNPNEDEY